MISISCSNSSNDEKSTKNGSCQRWDKNGTRLTSTYELSPSLKIDCILIQTTDQSIGENSNIKISLWDSNSDVWPNLFVPLNGSPVVTKKLYENIGATKIGSESTGDAEFLDISAEFSELASIESNRITGFIEFDYKKSATESAKTHKISYSSKIHKE